LCTSYINLHDSTLQNVGQKHCFDLQCSGFVQTNPDVLLGGTLSPVSKYGGPQAQLNIFIYQVCFCWYFWTTYNYIIFPLSVCNGQVHQERKTNQVLCWSTFTMFIFLLIQTLNISFHILFDRYSQTALIASVRVLINNSNLEMNFPRSWFYGHCNWKTRLPW
jgi:hypothetical protein